MGSKRLMKVKLTVRRRRRISWNADDYSAQVSRHRLLAGHLLGKKLLGCGHCFQG